MDCLVSLPEKAVALVEQQAAQPKAEPDTQQRTENVISQPAPETPVAAKDETPAPAPAPSPAPAPAEGEAVNLLESLAPATPAEPAQEK